MSSQSILKGFTLREESLTKEDFLKCLFEVTGKPKENEQICTVTAFMNNAYAQNIIAQADAIYASTAMVETQYVNTNGENAIMRKQLYYVSLDRHMCVIISDSSVKQGEIKILYTQE